MALNFHESLRIMEIPSAVMTSLVPPPKSPSEGPKRGPVLLKRGTTEGPRI